MAQRALRLTQDELMELALVDVAYHVMKAGNKTLYYRDLMNEVAALRSLSEAEVLEVIARLYTEINMDGRFLCVGNNVWGLKTWYPADKTVEKSAVSGAKRFIRKETDSIFDGDGDDDVESGYPDGDELEEDVEFEAEPDEVEEDFTDDEVEAVDNEETDVSLEELGESESEPEEDEEES